VRREFTHSDLAAWEVARRLRAWESHTDCSLLHTKPDA
jgi:hypothetical protein